MRCTQFEYKTQIQVINYQLSIPLKTFLRAKTTHREIRYQNRVLDIGNTHHQIRIEYLNLCRFVVVYCFQSFNCQNDGLHSNQSASNIKSL